jgi:hypothetical protein
VIISAILGLGIFAYNIYLLTGHFSMSFLVAIVIRLAVLPLVSLYNMAMPFLARPEDTFVRPLLRFFLLFVVVLELGLVICAACSPAFANASRLSGLPEPDSHSAGGWNASSVSQNPACQMRYDGLALVDLIGLALGGYDVERAPEIFDRQMRYVFGWNWTSRFSYTIGYLDTDVPYIVYFDHTLNATIYAFRGFTSAQELALWLQILAVEYILPVLTEIVPFYETIIETWFGSVVAAIRAAGESLFSPDSIARSFVDSVMSEYHDLPRTVFVGINVGGLIAKTMGMMTRHPGISFLSYPVFNEIFETQFDFEESGAWHITSVFNYGGLFTRPEPDTAVNFGIPWIEDPSWESATVFPNLNRDTVYRSFCVFAELCDSTPQFSEYCNVAAGKKWPTFEKLVHEQYLEDDDASASDSSE